MGMVDQLPLFPTLKERFKWVRQKRGLSQTALALKLGISQQSIEKLENGAVDMPKYLYKASEILEVPYQWLANNEIAFDTVEEGPKEKMLREEQQEFMEIMQKISDPEDMKFLKDQLLLRKLGKPRSERSE